MKRFTLPLIASALGATIATSHAADGTIRFTGAVTDTTCTIATGSQNLNVDLGKVAKTALNGAAGMQASPTRFIIALTGCPETVKNANVKFDGTAHSANPRLLALDSGTGIATGVGIQIADSDGSEIPLHTATRDYALATGANQLSFTARYVSTAAAVTTGTANGTSQFTINYK
jgi:P pilus assembly protein, pilin FimA